MAHNKLVYGTKQAGHIKVVSSIDKTECDCSHCEEKLTKLECDELRKNLFEYYLFFKSLIPQLNENDALWIKIHILNLLNNNLDMIGDALG